MRLERAFISAGYSFLFAGLGQLSQGRRKVALWHFLEVLSLLALGLIDKPHRALWVAFALAVNAWSVIDAFLWESRRRSILTLVLLAAVVAMTASVAQAQDAPAGFRGEFLHQFDQSMAKIIALAEAVPTDRYSRRPVPAVMPLAHTFAHIAHYNYEYPARAMGIPTPAGIDRDTLERVADKAQVVSLLRRSAEHVRQSVRAMPEAQLAQVTTLYGRRVPQWAVLLQLIAHMDDHLGQSIAYARVSGVVPPWSQ